MHSKLVHPLNSCVKKGLKKEIESYPFPTQNGMIVVRFVENRCEVHTMTFTPPEAILAGTAKSAPHL